MAALSLALTAGPTDGSLHHLPATVDYEGEARTAMYFHEAAGKATFRGRALVGVRVDLATHGLAAHVVRLPGGPETPGKKARGGDSEEEEEEEEEDDEALLSAARQQGVEKWHTSSAAGSRAGALTVWECDEPAVDMGPGVEARAVRYAAGAALVLGADSDAE